MEVLRMLFLVPQSINYCCNCTEMLFIKNVACCAWRLRLHERVATYVLLLYWESCCVHAIRTMVHVLYHAESAAAYFIWSATTCTHAICCEISAICMLPAMLKLLRRACYWGEPERAPVLLVSHGTYVRYTKISCRKWKAPHLLDEMVRTSDTWKFPVKLKNPIHLYSNQTRVWSRGRRIEKRD